MAKFSYSFCFTAFTCLFLFTGCAVGPDFEHVTFNTEKKWANARGEQQLDESRLHQWWKRLGDPVLNKLIDEAVLSNPDIAIALAKVDEARSLHMKETGGLFPDISGSGASTRRKTAGLTGSDPIRTTHQGLLDASWEIDFFGGNRRVIEAAYYNENAAEEQLRLALQVLIGDVTATYIEARNYQARLALARRTAVSQNETVTLIRTKVQAGAASDMDLAKAISTASNTEADIPTYQAAFSKAVHRLSVLSGKEPGALVKLMQMPRPIPLPRSNLPKSLPAVVLEQRPDIRIAEYQLAQKTAQIGVAQAARLPRVSLTGNISTSSRRIGDLGKNSTIGWSFGPALSVPIFNAGQLKAAVDVAYAQEEQAALNFHKSVLSALEEVENALVALSQEHIRYRSLTRAAQSQRQATQLAKSLYHEGSTSFLEVLDAERSLYSSEAALLQSKANISMNFITLAKALGGGWDEAKR